MNQTVTSSSSGYFSDKGVNYFAETDETLGKYEMQTRTERYILLIIIFKLKNSRYEV